MLSNIAQEEGSHSKLWFSYATNIPGTWLPARPGTLLQHMIYCQIIIYPKHWLPASMWRWAEFNLAAKLVVVDNEKFLCQHHLRMQRTSKTIQSERFKDLNNFTNGFWHTSPRWKKNYMARSAEFVQIWVCQQSIADALGTHRNRSPNFVSCITGKEALKELNSVIKFLI